MQERLDPSSSERGHATPAFRWSLALIVAAGMVGVAHLASTWAPNPTLRLSDPSCAAWDDAASAGLALLIADRSAAVDAQLSDALFRLRRARKYCSFGLRGLAQIDYQALIDGRYLRNQ